VIITQADGIKRPLQLNEIIEVLKIKTNENNALKEKITSLEETLKKIKSLTNEL
jgi:hypothetical protein